MIWPPIRYSYRTVKQRDPNRRSSAPSWTFDEVRERCNRISTVSTDPDCTLWQLNWLGTDDRAARRGRPHHLRLSASRLLFGLILTAASRGDRCSHRRRAVAISAVGRPHLPALHRDLVSIPVLYLIPHHRSHFLAPAFFILLAACCCFRGSPSSRRNGPSSCAPETSNICEPAATRALVSSNGTIMFRHLFPNRWWRRSPSVPFILNGLDHHTDLRSTVLGSACRQARPRRPNCCGRASATINAPVSWASRPSSPFGPCCRC